MLSLVARMCAVEAMLQPIKDAMVEQYSNTVSATGIPQEKLQALRTALHSTIVPTSPNGTDDADEMDALVACSSNATLNPFWWAPHIHLHTHLHVPQCDAWTCTATAGLGVAPARCRLADLAVVLFVPRAENPDVSEPNQRGRYSAELQSHIRITRTLEWVNVKDNVRASLAGSEEAMSFANHVNMRFPSTQYTHAHARSRQHTVCLWASSSHHLYQAA